MFKEIEEAQEILLNAGRESKAVRQILSAICGKVLAEDIYAPIDVPGFRRSPLDGFALRAKDTQGATRENPVTVKIIDEIQAGDTRKITALPIGTGVKILTGAPLPLEVDVVIRKEDVDYVNKEIIITKELEKDSNVIGNSSDFTQGEKVFAKGELIEPYHIGVLASLGLGEILVYEKPSIGLISTGNELKSPGEYLEYGQIYNSNMYALEALIKARGGQATNLGIVPDDKEQIGTRLKEALGQYDLLITTGGASVGDYDLIEQVLKESNAEILFNRIGIKPGSPVVCGILKDKLIVGLSGNPAASLISFQLLVGPLLKKMRGIKDVDNRYLEVELLDGFTKKSPQRRFLRVKVSWENGQWVANQTGRQESSILKSMIGCNALIDIPRGSGPIPPKTKVKALLLEEDFICYHP